MHGNNPMDTLTPAPESSTALVTTPHTRLKASYHTHTHTHTLSLSHHDTCTDPVAGLLRDLPSPYGIRAVQTMADSPLCNACLLA